MQEMEPVTPPFAYVAIDCPIANAGIKTEHWAPGKKICSVPIPCDFSRFPHRTLAVRVQPIPCIRITFPSVLMPVGVDPRRFFMSSTLCNTTATVAIWAGEYNELVWGHDR